MLAIAGALSPVGVLGQSSLDVYSRDLGGPNSAAPAGATRPVVFDMSVPRLHAVIQRLQAVEDTLNTHPIPPHSHAHTHPVVIDTTVTITVDGESATVSANDDGTVTVSTASGISFSMDTPATGTTLTTVTLPNGATVTIEAESPAPYTGGGEHGSGDDGFGNEPANPDGDGDHNKFIGLYTDALDPGFSPGVDHLG